jgi:hypothetical protein
LNARNAVLKAEDIAAPDDIGDLDEAVAVAVHRGESLRHELFTVLVIGAFGRRHSLSTAALDRLAAFRDRLDRLLKHDDP